MKNSRHKKTPTLAGDGVSGVKTFEGNHEMDNSTAVTPDNLPAISHAGCPVVTTALLAKLYGTDDNNLIQNYQRNSGRFVAGKHFHKLEGAELKAFKNYMTESQVVQVAKNTRQIILWTERGAARHAKMLDTDEAWEVFEKLEDCYFKAAETVVPALPAPTSYTLIGTTIGSDGFHCLSAVIDGKVSRLDKHSKHSVRMHIWAQLHKAFSVVRGEDIPAEKLESAMNFVAAYALEGQYLPRQAEPQFNVNRDGRYLLSFNHRGEQQITEVPDDAYVLSQREFLKGIAHTPGDIPITTDGLFEFAIAAMNNLRLRAQYLAGRAKA